MATPCHGGLFPCRAGRVGSTGAGRGEDSRDPTVADRRENVEIPEIQKVQSTQTFESLGIAPVRQVALAETVEGFRDRSASARRNRTTLVRHCTRLSRLPRVWRVQAVKKTVEIPHLQIVKSR